MSKAEDVGTLFRRFGGDASTYQEVVAEQQVDSAMGRWPLLEQINPRARAAAQPLVQQAVAAATRVHHAVADATAAPLTRSGAAPASVSVGSAHPTPPPVVDAPIAQPLPETRPLTKVFAEAVPVIAPAVTVNPDRSDLKALFQRMLPTPEAPAAPAVGAGLKRLAKW